MSKKPLISIDELPIEVWYESPSLVAVDKPSGIPVHPEESGGSGTVLNRLFQNNRWLAHMETSPSAGVFHHMEDQDHGLLLVAKDDSHYEALKKEHEAGGMRFRYLVKIKGEQTLDSEALAQNGIKVHHDTRLKDVTLVDVESSVGDAKRLRYLMFPSFMEEDTTFYCYEAEMTLPHSGARHVISLREADQTLPSIKVYHAPP